MNNKNVNFQLKNASIEQRREITKLCEKFKITIHCDIEKADLKHYPDLQYVGGNFIDEKKESICVDSCRDCDYEEISFEEFVNKINELYNTNINV